MKNKKIRILITAFMAVLTIFAVSASAFSITLTPGTSNDYDSNEPVMSVIRMMGNNMARLSGSYMLFSAAGHTVRAVTEAVKAVCGLRMTLLESFKQLLEELGIYIDGFFESEKLNPDWIYTL